MEYSYIGEISALFTAFLWSITAISFEKASKKVGSELVNMGRLIIAFFLLAITIPIAGLNIGISFYQILYLVLSGVIGLIFGDGFLFKALQIIGARVSMVVMSFVPAFSAILAFGFLNEVMDFYSILGVMITLSGIVIVVSEKNLAADRKSKMKFRGLLYAFFGAFGQAVGLILAKEAFNQGEINGFVATFYRIVAAIIFIIPLYFLKRNNPPPIKILKENPEAVKFLSIGAFVGPYLGITFSLIAVAYTYVGVAATIMSTVPIIMLPISRFYMKEKLSLIAISGAIAAVAGVALLFVK